jgi:hypothetical protein
MVGNLDLGWIGAGIEFRLHLESCARGGRTDQLDDHRMTDQWTTTPVHAEVGKQAMFNRVPFAGARWQMTHSALQPSGVGAVWPLHLPQARAIALAATTIRADQQAIGRGIGTPSNHLPPAVHARDRETGRVVVLSHRDPTSMASHVLDAIRARGAQLWVREIVDLDLLRVTLRLPFPPTVLERPDQFLLFGVH